MDDQPNSFYINFSHIFIKLILQLLEDLHFPPLEGTLVYFILLIVPIFEC